MILRHAAAAILAGCILVAAAARVPAPLARARGGDAGTPVEIMARDGIEWDRENLRYVARGDARVSQGDKTIEADTLTAFYRQNQSGNSEIYRYTASGNVRISTAGHRAVADAGVYDLDSRIVTLTGKSLKISTATQQITARDSIEYWEAKDMAVARGNALVVTADGRRIGADTLAAYFDSTQPQPQQRRNAAARQRPAAPAPAGTGDRRLERVEAFGNTVVTTATEVAQGETGRYNASTGIAVLSGNVKLTRGRNQASGDVLELNLNNGLYKLSCKPGTGTSCVRGLFVPEKRNERQQRP
jgi:lipopolysaccharide export system protein LptA